MEISETQDNREKLIENFGQHIESEGNLSPLAARILAHLVIHNRKGVTFDEMVDLLKASKSSVCTNLNILMHRGRITYYTQTGDRKRYFTLSSDVITERMEEKIKSCRQKIEMCNQVIEYKKQQNEAVNAEGFINTQLSYLEAFKDFLEKYKDLCNQHKQALINLKSK